MLKALYFSRHVSFIIFFTQLLMYSLHNLPVQFDNVSLWLNLLVLQFVIFFAQFTALPTVCQKHFKQELVQESPVYMETVDQLRPTDDEYLYTPSWDILMPLSLVKLCCTFFTNRKELQLRNGRICKVKELSVGRGSSSSNLQHLLVSSVVFGRKEI